MFIIATYYTYPGPYAKVVEDYLAKSMKNYPEFEFHIGVYEDQGSWHKNTSLKPRFILELFQKYNKDVILLDADATIEKYPELFFNIPEEYDIAAHYLSWKDWYGYSEDETKELLSGTLYLRNNDKVKKLCQKWYDEAYHSGVWEQQILQKLLDKSEVKVYNLPIEYTFIISRPGNLPPLIKTEPVILHHQVSRETRRK